MHDPKRARAPFILERWMMTGKFAVEDYWHFAALKKLVNLLSSGV